MAPVIIYITGFRQHAGKTVAALGIISSLKKIMDPSRIGFFKPVGQEMVSLAGGNRIDKDALIVDTFSGIPNIDIEYTSPVRLTSGFTRKYLDSPDPEEVTRKLRMEISKTLELMAAKDIIIAEGTGHPGVGSPLRILGFLPLIEDISNPSMHLISRKWENGETLGDPDTEAWKTPCKEIKVLTQPSEDLRRRNFLNPGDLIIISCASQMRSRSILKYNKIEEIEKLFREHFDMQKFLDTFNIKT